MDARPLPPRPNLEQYKKQAKDLLRACSSADPEAIHGWAEQWFDACAHEWVDAEAQLRGVAVTQQLGESIRREKVECIEKSIRSSELSKPERRLADAQFFVAREHGFESWPKFARQIQALEAGGSDEGEFEAAADAIVSGDIQALSELLRDDPRLIHARSQRVHNSTLLHYVAANGVEDFRQKTPPNIVEITKMLLDEGADVNAASNAYGGGATPLGLAATSVHPERAGVQEALLHLLLDRGAVIDKPGLTGNRHTAVESCLWNGRGRAARVLASRGARLNLETAAGTGRMDVVRSFFFDDGALKQGATQQQLQRGFVWACAYGCPEVAEFLLDRGADVLDQADTGATALHWAVGGGHLSVVRLLLERGAPLEEVNRWGGTVLGQGGWAFFDGDPEVDFVPIFELLLLAGAKIPDGWLAWLEQQPGRASAEKARVIELFRNHGAST